MKKWLIDNFLPMWAKETVLAENRTLKKEIQALEYDVACLQAYIRGMQSGMRAAKRVPASGGGAAK